MSIYIIKAAKPQAALALANALRDAQVSKKLGALLINSDFKNHAPQHQLEKIIDGQEFDPAGKLGEVPWKPESMLIALDEKDLMALEDYAPGLIKKHGPVQTITIK